MNESQLEFATAGTGTSQNAVMLDYLAARRGQWVSLPCLVNHVGAFAIHSRAADLRRAGHRIENRRERIDGKVHSWYRLV